MTRGMPVSCQPVGVEGSLACCGALLISTCWHPHPASRGSSLALICCSPALSPSAPISLGDPGQHRVTDPEMTVLWEGIWPSLGEAAQGGGATRKRGLQRRAQSLRSRRTPALLQLRCFILIVTKKLPGPCMVGSVVPGAQLCRSVFLVCLDLCAGAHSPAPGGTPTCGRRFGLSQESGGPGGAASLGPGSSCVFGSKNTRLPEIPCARSADWQPRLGHAGQRWAGNQGGVSACPGRGTAGRGGGWVTSACNFLCFFSSVIVTEKTNILLRYLHQQWDKKVRHVRLRC